MKRRKLLQRTAQAGILLGSAGVTQAGHRVDVTVTETDDQPVTYNISLKNGTDLNGSLEGSTDWYYVDPDTRVTGAYAWGRGNLEIDFSDDWDSFPDTHIAVEGQDYFRDGTNPTMSYSFTTERSNTWTWDLESGDSKDCGTDSCTHSGHVDTTDYDEWDTEGSILSIHFDVAKADKIILYRTD